MATVESALLAQVARMHPDEPVPIVLRFATGDGVRSALPGLRELGFVAVAVTPTEAAGEIRAGAVERLAFVPGLVAVAPSVGRRRR